LAAIKREGTEMKRKCGELVGRVLEEARFIGKSEKLEFFEARATPQKFLWRNVYIFPKNRSKHLEIKVMDRFSKRVRNVYGTCTKRV
jgi:hypothetical protein